MNKKNIKIVFASNNKGKYNELVADFAEYGIDLVMPKYHVDFPENSESLAYNAYTKAAYAAKEFNSLAMGDDSGIFVEALDYFPGVHSRRWTGRPEDDDYRNEKLLEMIRSLIYA